jgi:hypothetical protein
MNAPDAQDAKSRTRLTRVVFRVSRLMEFCTKRELQNQTGHYVDEWPLVVAKELIDNALDHCEETEVAPVIDVTVDAGLIIVADNGGGFDSDTIDAILDYSVRVSSREAYVSPTRGAQGNALKTVLAMGYVLDREHAGRDAEAVGVTIIETRSVKHRIEFRVDHINNQPKIAHTTTPSAINSGTKISIEWPTNEALLEYAEERFQELIQGYVWFNPHLTLRGVWYGCEFVNISASDPNWNGARAIRPARIGMTKLDFNAISPRMWPGTVISNASGLCANSSPSSAGSPELLFSEKYSKRLAARTSH